MSTRRELVFVPTSRTTWDLPRFVHLLRTFIALTPSRGHNHTGNKSLMQVNRAFFFTWYITHCTPHQKSTAALWMRKQLNKQIPQHIFLLTAWAFFLTSLFLNNKYNGPLLLHSLLETHSRLHCLPACLWAFAQDRRFFFFLDKICRLLDSPTALSAFSVS